MMGRLPEEKEDDREGKGRTASGRPMDRTVMVLRQNLEAEPL